MKKILSFLITLCVLTFPIQTINAQPADIIYDILDNSNQKPKGNGLDLINSLIGKNSKVEESKKNKEEKTKVISNSRELEKEINKESKKKGNIKSDKEQLKGIDVSKWNGTIDWKRVKKAGIDFCIIRTGYAKTEDYKFKYNIEQAIKNDMEIGVYHFSYAMDLNDVKKETSLCLKLIEPYRKHITLGVWFDYEYDSVRYSTQFGVIPTKKLVTSLGNEFCRIVEKDGYDSGIYTNLDFSDNYFTKDLLNNHYTWIASWNGKCIKIGKFKMWQYTDKGYVDGIGKVDMNIYYRRDDK